MKDIILVIVTALISGLLATLITILFQKRTAKYNSKLKIFETLMSQRYLISTEESVKALNSIDVVFYKDSDVRKAYKEFLDETEKKPEFNPNVGDKYLRLLEEMSKVLKLDNIHWDEIKRYYYPAGLSEKLNEETALRKAQLMNALESANRPDQQENSSPNEQFSQEIITEMIKNPDSIEGIMKLAKMFGADINDSNE